MQGNKFKYQNRFRKQLKKVTTKPSTLAFGLVGIQALESGFVPVKILDQARLTIARFVKKGAKIWIRVSADHPVTAKPSEVRMGKGKGALNFWAAKTRSGTIILEVLGSNKILLEKVLSGICSKLPVKACVVNKTIFRC